jgi:hypothetical protein
VAGINCDNSCLNNTQFTRILENILPNNTGYVVECAECPLGRGGHMFARIQINGGNMDVWHRSGWCSSGGTDCGQDFCIVSYGPETKEVYDSVKQSKCNMIYAVSGGENPICDKTPKYDNTTQTRMGCLNGNYEVIDGDIKTFGFKGVSNMCFTGVNKISTPCLDNRFR